MPVEWVRRPERRPDAGAPPAREPLGELHLWPYRSLPRRGFVMFIGTTAALVALPMIALLGSPVVWGILPFFVAVLAGLWWALERSYRDGTVLEELRVWPDRVELTRHNPRGPRQEWQADLYWTRVEMHEDGGPVPHYLTLRGAAGRVVELGAFLSEDERKALYADLTASLRALRP